jgi:hypothetical protein
MGSASIIISAISLCVSALALWRTRTSLTVFQEEDGTIQVTNNSPHAVTLVELGMVESDGSFKSFYNKEEGPELPHRVDARDTVSFRPSISMTVELELEAHPHGRSGCFVRMASGQLLGSRGRICSEVNAAKRFYWRIRSAFER